MKKLLLAGFILFSSSAQAQCYGADSYKTCYDYQSGNQYNISRYGDTTQMSGYNANTGSNWSQTSRTYGNTTYHNGYDSGGNSWNSTVRDYGSSSHYSGYDSGGNSFSKTCYKNYDGTRSCY